MSLDQQFNTIYDKLQQLLKQHQRSRKEIDTLRAALQLEQQKTQTAQEKISELQQQIAILKLAAGDMNEKDKKEFERQITQYVKQIDKAIAYLSQ